jgi:hypothetical protein
MQELHAAKFQQLLTNTAATHGATAVAGPIDLNGVKDQVVIRVTGTLAGGTNGTNPTVVIQHADDTNTASFGTTGLTNSSNALPTASGSALHLILDRRGKKRYVRLTISPPSGSTNSNSTVNAVAATYQNEAGPATLADIDASTNSSVVRIG